uniref:Putative actin-binding protein n=1 Tax=Xenopsylla cheopis TaxID=163159 RepID=A0A6M2DS74_XENCH
MLPNITDKEYAQLTVSIGKAVSMIESPVKEKHIRAAIIGTYHCRGGSAFWTVMLKQPLLEHRIVAWKFFYVLHKVLREGFHLCLPGSIRHKDLLINVGKLWGHLQEGYGKLIQLYCNLMLTKIDFHHRNPHIPGNLIMTGEELEKIYGDDINNYFQLSVEMFDYMDDILILQEAIISSLNNVTSMTSTGQCRLAPLIPCIQDSNQLYDFSVKLLFKLHTLIQHDTLYGHRDRFQKQFIKLKEFYNKARDYEYFANLIKIPRLPKRLPNFLELAEFRTYIPPVVVIPEPELEPEEPVREEVLLDVTAEPSNQQNNDLHDLIRERNALIHDLQTEIARLNAQINQLISDTRTKTEAMQIQFEELQARLSDTEQELEKEQKKKKDMEDNLIVSQKEIATKTEELEKKSVMQEEKFQRLKELYTNIRDEHVNLLRQKAEVDKQLALAVKEKAQLEEGQRLADNKNQQASAEMHTKFLELQNQYEQIVQYKERTEKSLQNLQIQSKEQITENQLLNESIINLQQQNEILKKIQNEYANLSNSYTKLSKSKSEIEILYSEILEKNIVLEKDLEVTKMDVEGLKRIQECIESEKEELETRIVNLIESCGKVEKENEELKTREIEFCEKFHERKSQYDVQFAEMVRRIDMLNTSLREKKTEFFDLSVKYEALLKEMADMKSNHSDINSKLLLEIQELRNQCEEAREEKMTLVEKVNCLKNEKNIVQNEVSVLVTQRDELEKKLKESIMICEQIKDCVEIEQKERNTLISRLNATLLQSAADSIRKAIHELDEPAASGTTCSPDYFRKTADEACDRLESLGQNTLPLSVVKEEGDISLDSCKEIISCSQLLCSVIAHAKGTSNTSTNIELGERLQEHVRVWGTTLALTLDQLAFNPSSSNKTEFHTSFHPSSSNSSTTANASTSSSGEGDVSRAFVTNSNSEQNGNRNNETCSIQDLVKQLKVLSELAGGLMASDVGLDALGDQVEDEMAGMDRAIEEAAKKIDGLLSASRTADSGIKLEVNEKILDACTTLMKAIRELVQAARSVQAEIVAEGKGSATAKEFYKRNHQWTEGLISAAKAVALGAKLLVSAADESLQGSGKFEALMVAAQEIAACSVRLVVASRVKAQRGSVRLQALKNASVGVGQATGAVVAAVKSCTQMVEAALDLDVSALNLHQAKKLEMESQVRLIELEQALSLERLKLASLRRQHYQLAGE